MAERVQTFRTVLWSAGGNNVGIVVPDEVVAAFGHGRRVPVRVTVDGEHTYESSVVSMGGRFLVSFSAAVRAATGRGAGDEVEVRLELDDAPRVVEPPADLAAAIAADDGAQAAWDDLSPGKRKAHVLSVEGAKTEETRARRVAKAVEALRG